MNCGPRGCTHNCNNGRLCDDSRRITRAAWGVDPEDIDIPWPLKALCIFGFIAVAAISSGVLDPFFKF